MTALKPFAGVQRQIHTTDAVGILGFQELRALQCDILPVAIGARNAVYKHLTALVLGPALSQQAREPAHRQSRGHAGSSQGGVRGKLEAVEGVGEAGRGALKWPHAGQTILAHIKPQLFAPLRRGFSLSATRYGKERPRGGHPAGS